MSDFKKSEAAILNILQRSMSIDKEPFDLIAKETGIELQEVITLIKKLKKESVIRNISGIFNGDSLGYYLSLVAMKVPENNIDNAADVINSHPGVSHNYLREHSYNIWFTLAEENKEKFNKSLEIISKKSGAENTLVLRNEKLLKIGVKLKIGDDKRIEDTPDKIKKAEARSFSDEEKEAIKLLQMDLPIQESPFKKLIEDNKSFLSEEQLIKIGILLLEEGIMRRYAAILRHTKAGYSSNAMSAWKVPQGDISEIEERFVMEPAITHLYLRTIHPGKWEYPLFAMIHARSEDELNKTIENLEKDSGLKDKLILNTLKEFKKKKVHYFSENFNEWKREYYD